MLKNLLFLILFACILYSQSTQNYGPVQCFSFSLDELFNPEAQKSFNLPIVFSIMISLVVLSYFFGNLLKNPHLLVWAKTEGVNVFWSGVLLISISGAITFSCTIATFFVPDLKTSPLSYLSNYLNNIFSLGKSYSIDLLKSSFNDMFSSMELNSPSSIYFGTSQFGIYYLAGKKEWASYKETLNSYLVPILGMIYAQKFIIENLFSLIVQIVLPTSLFIRIIPIFRDVGDFLIAVCLSIYFFLPIIYFATFSSVTNTFGSFSPDALNSVVYLYDSTIENALTFIAFLTILAVFIPNLILVVITASSMALYKAIKGFFSG
ncbi:MAG: hypothetical protein ACK4J0_00230 [Candidatus Anstonellaceae archaeon]